MSFRDLPYHWKIDAQQWFCRKVCSSAVVRLDWKRSFLPMIAFGKGQKRTSDRQLQLMTLIHGDFQDRQLATYVKSGQCPPTLRSQLDAQLPKLN